MQERRHAAIVFTDIIGYTALMGADEDQAFEVLRKIREIHTVQIEQFNSRGCSSRKWTMPYWSVLVSHCKDRLTVVDSYNFELRFILFTILLFSIL